MAQNSIGKSTIQPTTQATPEEIKKLKDLACKEIDSRSNDLNDISQKIWKNPELAYHEFKAHDLLTDFLEKEGFAVQKKTPLETSFIARYGDSKGLKIGICCEYDALPGIGHGCGHNLIAEAGVAAALGLKAVCTKDPNKFMVVVYGTPAEEGGGGKVKMIEKGAFKEIDVCMIVHPTPYEIPHPLWLGVSHQRIVFTGKSSHAAAAPWEGINALDAAVMCYNNVSMLRQQMKPSARIHGIIVDGGKKPNIIPNRSELYFYVRGVATSDVQHLTERLRECANGAAIASDCTFTMYRDEHSPDVDAVRTNLTMINLYVENAKALGVEFNDDKFREKLIASSDMGNVSAIKPSIHPSYKIKTNGTNHTEEFQKSAGSQQNQAPTINAAKSMAMTAIDIVYIPGTIDKINKEFNDDDSE